MDAITFDMCKFVTYYGAQFCGKIYIYIYEFGNVAINYCDYVIRTSVSLKIT